MKFTNDDKAQTGIILFIVIGLFLIGLVYIILSPVMDQNQKANNALINSSNPYTQERADMMTGIYDYFKYFPLYALLIFVVWGVKKAIDKQSGVL